MSEWEDYYEILDVGPEASEEEIKNAYRDKVFIFHPDRMNGAPESARHRAEEELKKINQAYEVLGDPQKRKEYHAEWLKKSTQPSDWQKARVLPPKPVVEPNLIRFDGVEPGETKRASFVIRNIGGPYDKIWFSNPDSWVRVVSWASVDPHQDDELPLRVNIEAEGKDWGKSYSEYIRVRLNEEETQVRIELQTKPEPVKEKAKSTATPLPVTPPPSISSPSPIKIKIRPWQIITVVALIIFIIWTDLGGVSRIWSPDTNEAQYIQYYGEKRKAQLSNTTQWNTWQFYGKAGDIITLNIIPAEGNGVEAYLRDPNGKYLIGTYFLNKISLAAGAYSHITHYTLPSTGYYAVCVRNLWNRRNQYEFQLILDNPK